VGFIRDHADRRKLGGQRWGAEPICAVLSEHGCKIAPSTYHDHVEKAPTRREQRDQVLLSHIRRVHAENYGVYGARKLWLQLNREGIVVARCTVERLMAADGLQGTARGKVKRTTTADPAAERARDLVGRVFTPAAPDTLWVADMTYISTWSGWVYVAFVVDAFARRILGWCAGTSMSTQLVLDALEQAVWTRRSRESRYSVAWRSPSSEATNSQGSNSSILSIPVGVGTRCPAGIQRATDSIFRHDTAAATVA